VVLLGRYPFAAAVAAVALAVTASVFVFARPQYHPHRGVTIRLPDKEPATDATGAAGWIWAAGTPGWPAGYTVKGYNVSGVQPVELQAAQLAAARDGLDAGGVRVLVSTRPGTDGVLAILAAPTLYDTPTKTCLAALIEDAPVRWQCPGATRSQNDLARSSLLVAAKAYPAGLYLVGVARGDVHLVVLDVPGSAPSTLYSRGKTWGQFEAAVSAARGATLKIYGSRGLVQTLPLPQAR
jgi:hypothetical protein